jgi:hypothetical protein
MAAAAPGEPVGDAVAIIDPERGLIRLSGAAHEVLVDFYYGAAANIGGGPYDRRDALADRTEGRWQATVGPGEAHADLPSALGSWADYCMSTPPPHQGAIVIADSGRYSLSGSITLPAGTALAIVAASGVRPAIRVLQDGLDQAPGALMIAGAGPGAALALDGLLIAAENIQLLGAISLDMAHCTLLPPRPGGGLPPPIEGAAPGIALAARHCLLGPLRLTEGTGLSVADSVVDAAGELAVGPTKDLAPGPDLIMARSTVFGGLRVGTLSADDSIITGPVTATAGELRFCYAPPSAAGPSRWRCQPDLAQESADLARARGEPAAPSDTQVLDHIRPRFTSAAYLSPAYAQLAADCPTEIAAGAEDGAELGVYHDLFQPQRMATLNAVVSEFLPVGAELGILFIT